MRTTLLLPLLALLPLPVVAKDFTPPQGCEAFMTVQSRGCRVSNHYRCSADAPGDQWRADFGQNGMNFLSRIDHEGQWLESYDQNPVEKQQLYGTPLDPASITDLLAGKDEYDFNLLLGEGGESHVTGHDRLTGKSFVIDGINLLQTEFDFTETAPDGTLLRRARGNEYLHPEWRLFFAGPSEWQIDGAWLPSDSSPVQFIFPGEPGFLATLPLFECDAVMSSYPNSRKATEAPSHDDL